MGTVGARCESLAARRRRITRPDVEESGAAGGGVDRAELEAAIVAQEGLRGVLPDAVVDVTVRALRDRLVQLEAVERRRQVTVVFADLQGFTSIAEAMDPERLANLVKGIWIRVDAIVVAHGGRVDKHIGDAVMAVWGALTTREDDPPQAVRASLEIVAALEDLRAETGVTLTMRVGVNTGPALVGTLGVNNELTVMGDAVNIASRLEHAAPPDCVLISHETYRHVRGLFDVQSVGELELKGKNERIAAYVVTRAKDQPFRIAALTFEGVESQLVGRDRELAALRSAYRRAVSASTAVALILVGEPGVGKTRLLFEFADWLELLPERVAGFSGRANDADRHVRLGLFRSILAARLGIRDNDTPETVTERLHEGMGVALTADEVDIVAHWVGFDRADNPVVRDLLGVEGFAAIATSHLERYLRSFGPAPVVMIVEDLHRADDDSLHLLYDLHRRAADIPLLIIGTARPDLVERLPSASGPEPISVYRLEALQRHDSERLVRELLRHVPELADEAVEMLVERIDGNPFYAEELVKMLIDRHVIVPAPDGLPWQLDPRRLDVEVPSTLTGVLQARLDLLSTDEQDVVRRAAVVGRAFWDDAVAALFDQVDEPITERVEAALDQARSRELISLQPESSFGGCVEFAFRHALLRDVAYDMVLLRDRPRLHEFAASWLAATAGERASEWASQIADHFRRSDDPARAASWYLMAGRRALDVYANEQARSLLERASDVSPADNQEQRIAALLLLDEVYDRLGDREAQRTVLDRAEEAARKTGRLGDQVDVLLARSRLNFNLSDYEAARTHASSAAAAASTAGLSQKETDALLWRAKSSTWTGDHERARNELREALELARQSDYPAGEGAALRYLAVVAGNQSRFSESLDLLEQALAVHQAVNDVESAALVLAQLATTEYNLGHFESAQRHLEEVVPRFELTGHRYRQAFAVSNLASIYNARGFLGRGIEYGHEAMPMLRDIDDKEGLAVNVAHLAVTARLVGRFDEAEELFRSSLDMARALRFRWLIADDLIYLAMVCLESARCAEAHDLLEQARLEAELADSPLEEGKRLLASGYLALADTTYEDGRTAFTAAAELLADIDNEELAGEARAGHAVSLLYLGDVPHAQRIAEEVFDTLTVDSTAACTTPPAVLLHILRVLDTTKSVRAIDAHHACASILSALEERIGDANMVTEYLTNPWVAALVHELSARTENE